MTDQRPPLELLGLEKNPFTEVSDAFFPGADRARQLEELRNVTRWPRRVMAVTGERGVGKTTLYRAVSNGLDPGVKAARINANLTSDTRSVLSAVIQGFGIAAPANSQPQLLSELIRLHVEEQVDAKRHCVVLVDDAQLLELRALEHLLLLCDAEADDGLRMAFFAEAHFVHSLDKAARRGSHAPSWHEMRLMPFTDPEARRYIAFRLGLAGVVAQIPFTSTQMALIVGGAGGLPGRINALASAILTGELVVPDERRVLPRMHRALAVLVLIVAGFAWLILRETVRPQTQGSDETGVEVGSGTVALAIPQAQRAATPGDDEAAGSAVDARDTALGLPNALPAPVRQPVPPANDVPSKPVALPRVEPNVDIAPRVTAGDVASGPHDSAWIRAQPAARFTLQLFAASAAAPRDKFLAAQGHPERFAVFQMRRAGKLYYVLLYGNYATRAEADAAAAALPSSMGELQPWVRTFGSVHASLD
jgi:type II secretory pathway predicted ATPase ExeA